MKCPASWLLLFGQHIVNAAVPSGELVWISLVVIVPFIIVSRCSLAGVDLKTGVSTSLYQ